MLDKNGQLHFDCRIISCERQPEYIHQTLAQIIASDIVRERRMSVTVIADTANRQFLSAYKHIPFIAIEYLTEQEARLQDTRSRHTRICYSFYRALDSLTDSSDGVVVFEDDVLVNPHFASLLEKSVFEATAIEGHRFVMNAAGKYRLYDDWSRRRGKYYVSYPGPCFYGLMGMYYCANTTGVLRQHLREHGFETQDGQCRIPADLLLGELFEEVPIFNTRYDLACHAGDVSHVSPGSPIRESSRTFHAGLTEWRVDESTLKMIIVVPCLSEDPLVDRFLAEVPSHLTDLDYEIVIVEDVDSCSLNRGMLFNIGFDLKRSENDVYFCFHDIDLIPEDSSCDYSYPITPVHLSSMCSAWNYQPPVGMQFDGVTLFSENSFCAVNGYSNKYWNCGNESDDMRMRLQLAGEIQWSRREGRFRSLDSSYSRTIDKEKFEDDSQQAVIWQDQWQSDGLSNLAYTVVDATCSGLVSRYRVQIPGVETP